MTDRDGFYSNYWQKQRSPNLQSNANDLIIYLRTAPKMQHSINQKRGNKGGQRGEGVGGKGGGGLDSDLDAWC